MKVVQKGNRQLKVDHWKGGVFQEAVILVAECWRLREIQSMAVALKKLTT